MTKICRGLRVHISDHEVQTAAYAGFAGFKNGRLIEALATAGFEVFVTGDKNLPHQQNLVVMPFGTVVLSTQSLPILKGCLTEIQTCIDASRPGSVAYVDCIGMDK